MKNPLFAICIGLGLAMTPPVLAEEAEAPASVPVMLVDHVLINGSFIKLGDIFANAGEKADVNVAYAPEPGEKATFDVNWLYRVAKAYGLDWRPTSRLDQTVVQRDSIHVGREEIEDAILAALAERGLDPDMEVEIGNRMLRIHMPADSDGSIAVEDVIHDNRTRRFTAVIAAPAGDPKAKRTRITGQLHHMTDVPAPSRNILAGEVINPRDIQWVRLRTTKLQRDTITNAADLIGKAPKRGLRPGAPIRTAEVRRPVLVPKNGMVTMILAMPNMTLTAQGRSLDDGSDGDTIRIANSKSNQVVEGVVTGANRVAVQASSTRLLMN